MTKHYRKYSNRKIYCLETSKIVTIPDLISEIRLGNKVQVVEHTTNEDVTLDILKRGLVTVDFDAAFLYNLYRG